VSDDVDGGGDARRGASDDGDDGGGDGGGDGGDGDMTWRLETRGKRPIWMQEARSLEPHDDGAMEGACGGGGNA
jgi:hypothetical protein